MAGRNSANNRLPNVFNIIPGTVRHVRLPVRPRGLVYQQDEDRDQILRDFAADLNGVLTARPQQTFCEALK
jgi:hypothetical protein